MSLQFKQGRLLTRVLPIFAWFSALVVVGFLFVNQSERVEIKGIAFSYEQSINSVETGYIRSIPVNLYEQVKKGDTLAVIKENTVAKEEYISTLLQARKATAEAELDQLKAELSAAEDGLIQSNFERKNEIAAMQRRLSVDIERARLEVLEISSSLEPDRLVLKDLEVELEIVQNLLDEQATEQYELQKVQAQYGILKETIQRTEQLYAQAQTDYETALLRKDEYEQTIPLTPQMTDADLAPIRKAIIVREKKLAELVKQRDIIVLTAPFDGIVYSLNYKPGQTVVRGDSIMTLVKPNPEYIMTWVRPEKMGRFDVNTQVEVVSLNAPNESFRSQIAEISPVVEKIPSRLWRHPDIPEWGRSMQISLQPNFKCVHNEVLGIKVLQQ